MHEANHIVNGEGPHKLTVGDLTSTNSAQVESFTKST